MGAESSDDFPDIYRELLRLAEARFRGRSRHNTLNPQALVNEAYIRLTRVQSETSFRWENRSHFYGIASRMMRDISVDHVRSRLSKKRGGGAERVPLEDVVDECSKQLMNVLATDELLTAYSAVNARGAKGVEMKFFGGLTDTEIAESLEICETTVKRDREEGLKWMNAGRIKR
jgi:RNA polymerase sigma-70 factor (ECF subfamily)